MHSLKKTIKSKDMFGHLIPLNFDQKGEEHNTFIGGFFSIGVKVFLTIYIILKLKILIFSEDDDCKSIMGANDLQKLGPIRYD